MKYLFEHVDFKEGLPMLSFITSKSHIPMHWHKEMEILLVLIGAIVISIGKNIYKLKEDDIIVVNGEEIHSIIAEEDKEFILLGIQINPDFCSKYYPKLDRVFFKQGSFLRQNVNSANASVCRYYLARYMWETLEKENGFQLALEGIVHLLLSHLIRNFDHIIIDKENVENKTKELQRLRPILDYIKDKCFTEKLSLQEIAEQFFISFHYLSHLFKEKMGISYQEYVNSIRLNKALYLLKYSDKKIVDIIYDCGFSGPKFFNKFFKRKCYCTPSEYREEYTPQKGKELLQTTTSVNNQHFKNHIDLILNKLLLYLETCHTDRDFSKQDLSRLVSNFQHSFN